MEEVEGVVKAGTLYVVLKLQSVVGRLGFAVISTVYRRRGVLLLVPLLYMSGMLLYIGTSGFDSVVNISSRHGAGNGDDVRRPGSVYRSPQLFEKLWPFMEAENNGSSNLVKKVCDAVAVAGLLNATLVIPIFHLNSVWRDSSKFGDIFDEEFFVYALKHHVNIVRELPEDVLQRFDNNIGSIINLRVKAWLSPTYYVQKVLPKLLELGAVRIAPFSNRLAQAVPPNIQGLQCLSNFEALRFSESIRMLAAKMVDRMVKNSLKSGGKYVSVHLRFEEDMVAFSCCIYDGGEEEKSEMDIARERSWRGKFHRRGRIIRQVQTGGMENVH